MNKVIPQVRFHFPSACNLPQRRQLKAFILSIFQKEKRAIESIDIVFCDDNYVLSLNQQFLRHDYYTDILSFPLSDKGKPLMAEIYISTDRVTDNAKNLESSFREELHRVIFHGLLHFCGYNDKSLREKKTMRDAEDYYLKAYFKYKRNKSL